MAIDSVPRTLPLEAADEGRLVARAQLGEQPAREELARRFRQLVYLLALQIVGNKDDALDPEQKTGRREREQQVWRAIAALSPSHRRSSFSATFTTWPIRKSLRFSRFRSAP